MKKRIREHFVKVTISIYKIFPSWKMSNILEVAILFSPATKFSPLTTLNIVFMYKHVRIFCLSTVTLNCLYLSHFVPAFIFLDLHQNTERNSINHDNSIMQTRKGCPMNDP